MKGVWSLIFIPALTVGGMVLYSEYSLKPHFNKGMTRLTLIARAEQRARDIAGDPENPNEWLVKSGPIYKRATDLPKKFTSGLLLYRYSNKTAGKVIDSVDALEMPGVADTHVAFGLFRKINIGFRIRFEFAGLVNPLHPDQPFSYLRPDWERLAEEIRGHYDSGEIEEKY